MSQRTIFELHCDVPACTSVVRGPEHRTVLDSAFGAGGWTLATVQQGHGTTEVIHKCPRHTEVGA
jgi:hypothetical protein